MARRGMSAARLEQERVRRIGDLEFRKERLQGQIAVMRERGRSAEAIAAMRCVVEQTEREQAQLQEAYIVKKGER